MLCVEPGVSFLEWRGPMLISYLVGVVNLSKFCPVPDVGRQDL